MIERRTIGEVLIGLAAVCTVAGPTGATIILPRMEGAPD
jgi:hypothetical protein